LYRAPRTAVATRRRYSRSYQASGDAIRPPPTTAPTSNWGSTIGGGIGSLFGPAGSALGSLLGHGAQSLVKMVTGFGDYNIQRNSLMPGALEPPIINNATKIGSRGGIVVRHREYIGDISPSVAFVQTTYSINAGLVSTFPWLSQIGASFEEYCIHGMLFEFKSMSSDAVLSSSANSSLGTVIMATQYNALNPGFVDKREMENYEFANSSKPSESFIHPIECKGNETPIKCLFIRTGAVPANADQRLYDLGDFSIATQGMQSATGVIGELWVSFEIEFYKPKLISSLGLELLTDHFRLTAVSNTRPLGAAVSTNPQPGSNLGSYIFVNGSGATTVIFPPYISDGEYQITYIVTGTAAAITPPSFGAVSNCTFTPLLLINGTSASNFIPGGVTTPVYFQVTIMTVTGPGPIFSVSAAGTLPSSITSGDLIIAQINASLT